MAFVVRPLLILAALVAGMLAWTSAAAAVVVVVNSRSGVEKLSNEQVINIFLGRFRQFPNGAAARPVDLPASEPAKAEFYRLLVGKDLDQIAAYWSRLVFTGRTSPPTQVGSTEDLIRYVSTTPGAVGYLDGSFVDKRVKVVLELK